MHKQQNPNGNGQVKNFFFFIFSTILTAFSPDLEVALWVAVMTMSVPQPLQEWITLEILVCLRAWVSV